VPRTLAKYTISKTEGVFASKWEEGGRRRREGVFFVFVFMVLRVGERMGERVEGFFHSSQNEEICGD